MSAGRTSTASVRAGSICSMAGGTLHSSSRGGEGKQQSGRTGTALQKSAKMCRRKKKKPQTPHTTHPCSLPEDSSELVIRSALLGFATAAFIQQDTGSLQHRHPELVGLDRRGGITVLLLSPMMKRPGVLYGKEALSYLLRSASWDSFALVTSSQVPHKA